MVLSHWSFGHTRCESNPTASGGAPGFSVTTEEGIMNLPELKLKVMRALNTLYAQDSQLISQNTSEWSIAHRLAVYLEREFPEWNVDCEYNRQGPGIDPKTNACNERIRPDIVLHHRGRTEQSHNLLVVELKKQESVTDCEKASEYTKAPDETRTFQYQYGLALTVKHEPLLRWFQSGEQLDT